MKAPAILICLAAAASFLVNGAVARVPDEDSPYAYHQSVSVSTPVAPAETRKVTSFRPHLSRLVLPNIDKLSRQLQSADRSKLQPQLVASHRVIAFWKNHRWLMAPRHKKCWQVPWQRSCTVARASLRLHVALATIAEQRLDHEIPLINDWRTAVRWVQKIYPGTESWMLSISDREGGWGPWVWYGGRTWSGYHIGNDFLGADTVGGWMQFRYSTFAPYWRQAQQDLRSRGYTIPLIPMPPEGGPIEYAGWLSPLAQALTAGYMRYTGKDGCHWCI